MNSVVLTCPACQTRYKSDAASIGEGRTVRCAKCQETWFVPPAVLGAADPDALALADNVAAQDANAGGPAFHEPEVSASASFGSRSSTPPSVSAAPTRDLNPEPMPEPRPAETVGADVMMRDLVDAEKLARRRRTIRMIWALAAILVIAAALIAWFNRQEIVNRYPQMADLYQAIGVEVRRGGLELDPPRAKTLIMDGLPVLRVESTIRNLTPRSLPVPLIELTVHDSAGQDLAQWYVETQPRIIEARGSLDFTTDYTDPPENTVGIRYRLAYNPG